MEKIYILSNKFEYSNMITYDAGPNYAKGMNWPYNFIESINTDASKVYIVDQRIREDECFQLEECISKHRNTLFIFKIVDPFYEHCKEHFYYKFLFRIKNLENIYFLSTYQPEEIVRDLDDLTNNRKMLFMPYPFRNDYVVSPSKARRTKKIIFSGARDPNIYPYRYKFAQEIKRNPMLWVTVHNLKHPGYPDVGQEQTHNYIGESYIQYLKKFQFMFISPSRCGMELLKYTECAYARTVPVGKAPKTFTKQQKEAFLELDFDRLSKSIFRIFSIRHDEIQAIADAYHLAMKTDRDAKLLNKQLDDFIMTTKVFI